MVSNRLFICAIFICILFPFCLFGQEGYAPVGKATYDGKYLKLTFVNCSNAALLAPDLKKRRGNDSPVLFEEYWKVKNDTIELFVTKEVSTRLYHLLSREGGTTSGTLHYTDHWLRPGKRYRSKTELPLPDNVTVLKLGPYVVPLCR